MRFRSYYVALILTINETIEVELLYHLLDKQVIEKMVEYLNKNNDNKSMKFVVLNVPEHQEIKSYVIEANRKCMRV